MQVHPMLVGLVVSSVTFVLCCPFVLWLALPTHQTGNMESSETRLEQLFVTARAACLRCRTPARPGP